MNLETANKQTNKKDKKSLKLCKTIAKQLLSKQDFETDQFDLLVVFFWAISNFFYKKQIKTKVNCIVF